MPAEPGPEGIAERARIGIVGQFVLLPQRKGQAFPLERFRETQDCLVLYDTARRRNLPVLIAQVAREPTVEVVTAAGHGEPALRGLDMVIGAMLQAGHGVGGAEGFDKLDAAPGAKVGSGLRRCLGGKKRKGGDEGDKCFFHGCLLSSGTKIQILSANQPLTVNFFRCSQWSLSHSRTGSS